MISKAFTFEDNVLNTTEVLLNLGSFMTETIKRKKYAEFEFSQPFPYSKYCLQYNIIFSCRAQPMEEYQE